MWYPTKKLWEIVKVINGRAYKKNELLQSWRTPILRVWNLFTKNEWYYSDLILEDEKYINNGDLIFAWSASFWPFIWLWDKVIYHYHIWKLICSDKIIKEYLFLYLWYITDELKKWWNWVWMIHVTKWMMEDLKIPLPPLPTQKLIVQKLDSSFEKIDKSTELTKKNLENIEELNKSVLEEVFREWEFKINKLWNILQVKHWYAFKWEFFSDSWSFLLLTPWNFSKDSWLQLRWKKDKYYIWDFPKEYLLKKWDLLIALTDLSSNAPILWAPWFINQENMLHNQRLWLIEKVSSELYNKYLYYYFHSFNYRSEVRLHATWTTVRHTSPKKIYDIKIPLPSLEKQKEIVKHLDQVFEKNRVLKEKYKKKLKDLEEMKQSLLKEAFAWRLVKE